MNFKYAALNDYCFARCSILFVSICTYFPNVRLLFVVFLWNIYLSTKRFFLLSNNDCCPLFSQKRVNKKFFVLILKYIYYIWFINFKCAALNSYCFFRWKILFVSLFSAISTTTWQSIIDSRRVIDCIEWNLL